MKNISVALGITLVCFVIIAGLSFTGMVAKNYAIGQALKSINPSTSLAYGGKSCADSDGGDNIYLRGTCTDAGNTKTFFVDYCYDVDADQRLELTEYGCVNNQCKVVRTVKCTYGCKDGACIRSATAKKAI